MICTYADLRRSLRIYWYRTDKGALVFLAFTFAVLAGLGLALQAVFAYQDVRRERDRAMQESSLACLARNIYFEARGEPVAGQFAVAEVTMNRKASRLFPRTVCEVVYQKTWDPIRKREVAAFSWTEFKKMPRRSTTTAIRRSSRARSTSTPPTSGRSGRRRSGASRASAGTSSTASSERKAQRADQRAG
jgi:hypothetical protein